MLFIFLSQVMPDLNRVIAFIFFVTLDCGTLHLIEKAAEPREYL